MPDTPELPSGIPYLHPTAMPRDANPSGDSRALSQTDVAASAVGCGERHVATVSFEATTFLRPLLDGDDAGGTVSRVKHGGHSVAVASKPGL